MPQPVGVQSQDMHAKLKPKSIQNV